jgi:hypothetical protein
MIYEATITYVEIDDKGNDKNVKKNILVDEYEFFGECEALIMELFDDYTSLDVIAIKRSKIREILNKRDNENQKLYIATLSNSFVDEDGNEKETNYPVVFFADDMDNAYVFITEYIKQGYNLILVGLRKSNFKDIIHG